MIDIVLTIFHTVVSDLQTFPYAVFICGMDVDFAFDALTLLPIIVRISGITGFSRPNTCTVFTSYLISTVSRIRLSCASATIATIVD